VYTSLRSLARLVALGIIPLKEMLEYVQRFACLILHPSRWVRDGAQGLVAAAWRRLGWPQALIRVANTINPLLREEAGDAMWHEVAAALAATPGDQPHDDWGSLSALGAVFLRAAIRPMTTAQLDVEIDRATRAQLRAVSPASTVQGNTPNSVQRKVGASSSNVDSAGSQRFGGGGQQQVQQAFQRSRRDIDHPTPTGTSSRAVGAFSVAPDDDDPLLAGTTGSMATDLGPYRPLLQSCMGVMSLPSYAMDVTSNRSQLLAYHRQLLGSYIDEIAGPYRVSAACDTRILLRAMRHRLNRSGGAAATNKLQRGLDSVTRAYLSREGVRAAPYSDAELSQLIVQVGSCFFEHTLFEGLRSHSPC
jgi:hypothetical protein